MCKHWETAHSKARCVIFWLVDFIFLNPYFPQIQLKFLAIIRWFMLPLIVRMWGGQLWPLNFSKAQRELIWFPPTTSIQKTNNVLIPKYNLSWEMMFECWLYIYDHLFKRSMCVKRHICLIMICWNVYVQMMLLVQANVFDLYVWKMSKGWRVNDVVDPSLT